MNFDVGGSNWDQQNSGWGISKPDHSNGWGGNSDNQASHWGQPDVSFYFTDFECHGATVCLVVWYKLRCVFEIFRMTHVLKAKILVCLFCTFTFPNPHLISHVLLCALLHQSTNLIKML